MKMFEITIKFSFFVIIQSYFWKIDDPLKKQVVDTVDILSLTYVLWIWMLIKVIQIRNPEATSLAKASHDLV